MEEEKEKCKTTKGLYSVTSSRFKPCHNHIILSLLYKKLHRKAMSLPSNEWTDSEQKKLSENIQSLTNYKQSSL